MKKSVYGCFFVIALLGCFFESAGENMNESIAQRLGKRVNTFTLTTIGAGFSRRQILYTTELSRILLAGEPRWIRSLLYVPIVDRVAEFLLSTIDLVSPLYDQRFANFVSTIETSSQRQLQGAIEDALLLTTYNEKAYSAGNLLKYLSQALETRVAYIKHHIEYDAKWDQKSLRSTKKSVGLATGLATLVAITNQYIGDSSAGGAVSNVEGLNAIAALSLLPVSCLVVKNCYKLLTTNPNSYRHSLDKHQELLVFVQNLKTQLETNGFITFQLPNGRIATVRDGQKLTVV